MPSSSQLFPNFVGGSYQALSPVIAADQCVNLFTETTEIDQETKKATLYGTPGLDLFIAATDTVGCRGWFFQDGLTLVTIGTTLYHVDIAARTKTALGMVTNNGVPVSYTSNGQAGDQVGILSAGVLRVLTRSTLVLSDPIVLPFDNPVLLAFMDGYTIANEAGTPRFWFSALEDMTSWDALDFATRSNVADNIVGICVTQDRLWCLGSQATTLFYDSGDADTPFVPYPGTTVLYSLVNPYALFVYQDNVIWVAEAPNGQRHVVIGKAPTPQRISTAPIDLFLSNCGTLANATLGFYEQAGHPFLIMRAPGSPDDINTYVYDLKESLWHARASWDPVTGRDTTWRAHGFMVADALALCGDVTTGDLYLLDLTTYTENGQMIRRERTAPYLGTVNQWFFLDQLELGMQAGVGLSTGPGSDPQVTLEISRDGARTWFNAGTASLGKIGAYLERAFWTQLGRTRLDRLVVKVTMSDPVACVWGPGLWLRGTPGTGQL